MIKQTFQYGDLTVNMETGRMARQADGAVLLSLGDTTVLATVVGVETADESRGFFPLTVNYMEKTYAAGKVPGGYFKREGRPSEKEILTCRLIDRPIRPLFPKGFKNEVQVIITVMAVDPEINPDIPSMLATSAALAISGIPFKGPIGAARVGYIDGNYVLNPTYEVLDTSDLDLVVAGTENAVLMVESEAQELSEEVMLGAVMFGHEQMQTAITEIKKFAEEAGKPPWDWTGPAENETEMQAVSGEFSANIAEAYTVTDKQMRQKALSELKTKIVEHFVKEDDESAPTESVVRDVVAKLEKDLVRGQILESGKRIDGRDTKTVRAIAAEHNVIPRVHGTALFTRGETQAFVACTLGSGRDAQIVDALEGEIKDNFMLHYNFPPYCVGEAGFMTGPKRREIGHGKLAKRAIQAVMPDMEEFPYVIRLVSEVTESNGSSSMATVCGSSLALMDAGVPIKAHVAGIAMGLIKEGDNYAVLSDILGDKDHLGDMDFKVAGTSQGITALQMDIKIDGITKEIMEVALEQAKEGRLHILDIMQKSITGPAELSDFAPRIIGMQIKPDKIRDVIGKGGATIRDITETTGATIDISDEGFIQIFAVDGAAGEAAQKRIEELTTEAEVGTIYDGSVVRIVDFGAFVRILPGQEGLVHISQIANRRIEKVTDVLSEGQSIKVKVIEIDRQGRIRLSMKEVETEGSQEG